MGILICGSGKDLIQNWVNKLVYSFVQKHREERVDLVIYHHGSNSSEEIRLMFAKLVDDGAGRFVLHNLETQESLFQTVSRLALADTICVAINATGLDPIFQLPWTQRRRVIAILSPSGGAHNASCINELRLSCFDFTLLLPAIVVNGPATSNLLVEEASPVWPPEFVPGRCITSEDLVRIIEDCSHRGKPYHRLCRIPRMYLHVHTYNRPSSAHFAAPYQPKMTRMRESYDGVLLKAPFSRWGGLKASESRTNGATYTRRDQKQPLGALVCLEGNIMPKKLRMENHTENLFGILQTADNADAPRDHK